MKLPSHIIQSVKWFEHYRERGGWTFGDRFVLHFHQWWRFDKTIWMEGCYHHTEDGTRLYEQSSEAKELLAQLKEQCKDQA